MRVSGKIGAVMLSASLLDAPGAPAQSSVPVQELSPPMATSVYQFGSILGVRALTNGNVLVNDGTRRQLLLMDKNLKPLSVVLDSTPGRGYGAIASPLLAFRGDSSLFVDGASSSLVVIDGTGKVVGAIAPPQPRDLRYVAASPSALDANGNLFYRAVLAAQRPPAQFIDDPVIVITSDSAPIVRGNLESRTADTVALVRNGNGSRGETRRDEQGVIVSYTLLINPIQALDEWTVTSNGHVAIVRGSDYHIDWIRADGSRISSPKMPFDWQRLTDADKQFLVDSARKFRDQQADDMVKMAMRNAAAGAKPPVRLQIAFVPMKDMADYRPAIRAGAVRADADGNVWILPTTSALSKDGELVYDVVNEQGVLFKRVRLPAGRSIAGFAKGGMIFLMSKPSVAWTLERAELK